MIPLTHCLHLPPATGYLSALGVKRSLNAVLVSVTGGALSLSVTQLSNIEAKIKT